MINSDLAHDMPKEPLAMDVHQMNVSEQGVLDFFWPVSYAERQNFCDGLRDGYVQLISKYEQDNFEHIVFYKIMTKYFLTEGISVFWGDLLRARFSVADREAMIPEHWRLWPSLFRCEVPKEPRFLSQFMAGGAQPMSLKSRFSFSRIKKIGRLIKPGKGGINLGSLKIKPMTPFVLQNDIIATQRDETLSRHAGLVADDVVFCRSDRWYAPIGQEEINSALHKLDPHFMNDLILLIESLYQDHGIKLEKHARIYFQNIMEKGIAALSIHYGRLLEKPKTLPRRIWTGSGGHVWDLMLRLAVMQNGGEAIGHDHGAGLGHVDNPMMGLSEFWGCNQFVSFNKNQGIELQKNLPKWPCLDKNPALAVGLDTSENPRRVKHFTRFKNPDFKIKTVVMMATVYDHDRGRPGPSSPDITHVDWQARLIPQLRDWGYNVILKLHPESPVLPPEIFKTKMGAQIVTTPLEDMLEDADMILFDSVYTTTFRSTLGTNIPMVLIDFFDHPWTKDGKDMFVKRASFLQGWFDADNKQQIEWGDLEKAIKTAPHKANSHDFYEYYYG